MTDNADRPEPALCIGRSLFRLREGERYQIGSGKDADIRIGHHSVGDAHARLRRKGVLVTIEDLGSEHGTWLGDNRVSGTVSLQVGQAFRVGSIQIELVPAPELRPIAYSRAAHAATFGEVMAHELRRAPWFLVSAAVHAAVLLVLAWYLGSEPPPPDRWAMATLAPKEVADEALELIEQPDEEVEIEEPEEQVELMTPQMQAAFAPELEPEPLPQSFEAFDMTEGLGARVGRSGGGSGVDDIFQLGSEALRRGGLEQTVAKLRETGFEITFVFDSTGSMQWVLDAAKERIFRMAEVLHELVPAARIGIVTYRDHGRSEAYLTRSLPLSHDYYQVIGFMHSVDAGGGGDVEEAVYEGVRTAIDQDWLPRSKRVVVVVGDAPPHRQDEGKLRAAVRAFARANGFVHTLITDGDRPDREAVRTFQELARAGSGEAAMLESEDAILQQILAIAMGREYRRDLDEIDKLVTSKNARADVKALDDVKRADFAAIERALRRRPVSDDYVRAIVTLREPQVTRWLIGKLGEQSTPAHTLYAMSYCVMKCLKLPRPPIDPEVGRPLAADGVKRLLRSLD